MIKRVFENRLREMLDIFPVVAVMGSRQVGKSTLVRGDTIAAGRKYVTLDDLSVRSLAEKDPLALVRCPERMTIDEIQLAPGLLRAIKQAVDEDRTPGRFLITGSSDLNYGADLSHVLAGRVGVMWLPPITLFEQREEAGTEPAWLHGLRTGRFASPAHAPVFDWARLVAGGFPLSLLAPDSRTRFLWMESFRETYLERDLRRISDIGHLSDFARLMELSAARTGQLLNQASLARSAGLNAATAGRYFSILDASFLTVRLAPYFANVNKRLVKSPKFFWSDTGLAAHLLGLNEKDFPGPMSGPLFETFVMMEVRALLAYFLPSARLYHFRSHDGLEVDGIIRTGSGLTPFEVKAARTVSAADAAPIQKWRALGGNDAPGMVLYAGDEITPLAKNVWAVPITAKVGNEK